MHFYETSIDIWDLRADVMDDAARRKDELDQARADALEQAEVDVARMTKDDLIAAVDGAAHGRPKLTDPKADWMTYVAGRMADATVKPQRDTYWAAVHLARQLETIASKQDTAAAHLSEHLATMTTACDDRRGPSEWDIATLAERYAAFEVGKRFTQLGRRIVLEAQQDGFVSARKVTESARAEAVKAAQEHPSTGSSPGHAAAALWLNDARSRFVREVLGDWTLALMDDIEVPLVKAALEEAVSA